LAANWNFLLERRARTAGTNVCIGASGALT
jgi:hypothetical protein